MKPKHIKNAENAEKNLSQIKVLNEVVNIPQSSAAEVLGNQGGEANKRVRDNSSSQPSVSIDKKRAKARRKR